MRFFYNDLLPLSIETGHLTEYGHDQYINRYIYIIQSHRYYFFFSIALTIGTWHASEPAIIVDTLDMWIRRTGMRLRVIRTLINIRVTRWVRIPGSRPTGVANTRVRSL